MKITGIIIVLAVLFIACTEAPYQPSQISPDMFEGYWVGLSKITYPGPDDGGITESIMISYEFTTEGDYYYAEYSRYEVTPPIVMYYGKYTINDDMIVMTPSDWSPPNSPLHVAGALEVTAHGNELHLYQKVGEEFPTYRWVDLEKITQIVPADFYILGR